MDDMVRGLVTEQRRRLVAGLMGHAEQEFFDVLTPAQRKAFRDKVLASVNAYHDFVLDVIKVSKDDHVRNEHAVTLIQQVHESQRRLEAELARG
jgi:hypothetical protein